MIVSCNEIASLALKACRGAGMSWGLAEEAARAAGWLARNDFDWAASLRDVLAQRSALAPPTLASDAVRPSRRDAMLCPIHAGALVADLLGTHRKFELHQILQPIWLLPFAACHAANDSTVSVRWVDGSMHIDRYAPRTDRIRCSQPGRSLSWSGSSIPWIAIELQACDAVAPHAAPAPRRRVHVDDADWNALDTFAIRTCVPASVKSRLDGAGAGLLETD